MTPERAKALEAVAEAVRLWRDHKSPSRLSDLLQGIHILDALSAEPADAGEMVEVRAAVWWQVHHQMWTVAPEDHGRDGVGGDGLRWDHIATITARIPRPVVPEVVAEVVKP